MREIYPLIWSGQHHTIRVARNWNVFWGLAATCRFHEPRRTVLLPPGGTEEVCRVYRQVEAAQNHFGPDGWWSWSRKLCDDFADCYVSKRPRAGNDFWDIPGAYVSAERGAKMSASAAKGFIGPADWRLG
jgi:hypothetical protein